MNKFSNKYNINSTRLKYWDYGSDGVYYVTICIKNREHVFGEIENNKMIYSEIGAYADKCWNEIPLHFPICFLDEYIIMPDHIHGIIIIDKKKDRNIEKILATQASQFEQLKLKKDFKTKNKFGTQSQNLGSIIRGYKTAITTYSTIQNKRFFWQRLFHDRILRTIKDYCIVKTYIKNNPINWNDDDDFFL
ncbi:MAG: hypothetical protein A2W91_04165 [Bacteroidetes bacterium GWF2_38_335]|nr:MAG: hypothetical protein A2W91_04165 [Bacteroidetes bacterium GWF2_38_335]OFY79181.1 MAG: hypothetical protein A2281_03500 [Bacteroidetes bacterium RIFOXYA12_FULL_38_20]